MIANWMRVAVCRQLHLQRQPKSACQTQMSDSLPPPARILPSPHVYLSRTSTSSKCLALQSQTQKAAVKLVWHAPSLRAVVSHYRSYFSRCVLFFKFIIYRNDNYDAFSEMEALLYPQLSCYLHCGQPTSRVLSESNGDVVLRTDTASGDLPSSVQWVHNCKAFFIYLV